MTEILSQVTYCGGYSGEDPPLPIPNREVKLTGADGSAPPGVRVGSCRFSESPIQTSVRPGRTLFFYARRDARTALSGGRGSIRCKERPILSPFLLFLRLV